MLGLKLKELSEDNNINNNNINNNNGHLSCPLSGEPGALTIQINHTNAYTHINGKVFRYRDVKGTKVKKLYLGGGEGAYIIIYAGALFFSFLFKNF